MKVEKCPRCGTERMFIFEKFGDWFFYPYPKNEDGCTPCLAQGVNCGSRFLFVSKLKWNCWARREAKRIAKEGKGK